MRLMKTVNYKFKKPLYDYFVMYGQDVTLLILRTEKRKAGDEISPAKK